MDSSKDVFKMFDTESQKLQKFIDTAGSKPDLEIHEIVEIYYQVMNVSSMAAMLRENDKSESKLLLEKIHKTEKLISEQFNSNIHPQIMKFLADSILTNSQKLQSGSSDKSSKEEIELNAKLFENLRQKMSTKEFVEQYDKSLNHD